MADIRRRLEGADLVLCCHKRSFLGDRIYGDISTRAVKRRLHPLGHPL